MSANNKTAFRIIFFIAAPKLAHRETAVFKERQVPVQYILRAGGYCFQRNHGSAGNGRGG